LWQTSTLSRCSPQAGHTTSLPLPSWSRTTTWRLTTTWLIILYLRPAGGAAGGRAGPTTALGAYEARALAQLVSTYSDP
jgi:hypothetical protein